MWIWWQTLPLDFEFAAGWVLQGFASYAKHMLHSVRQPKEAVYRCVVVILIVIIPSIWSSGSLSCSIMNIIILYHPHPHLHALFDWYDMQEPLEFAAVLTIPRMPDLRWSYHQQIRPFENLPLSWQGPREGMESLKSLPNRICWPWGQCVDHHIYGLDLIQDYS